MSLQTPRDPAVFTSPRPPTAPSPGSRPRTSESPRRGSKSAKGKSLTSDLAALVAEVRLRIGLAYLVALVELSFCLR